MMVFLNCISELYDGYFLSSVKPESLLLRAHIHKKTHIAFDHANPSQNHGRSLALVLVLQ